MKHVAVSIVFVLAMSAPAFAAADILTEDELASVIAGESSFLDLDVISDQEADNDSDTAVGDDLENFTVNDDVQALNPVNVTETTVDNSITNDNSVKALILMDDVQKDAIAMNIINAAGSNNTAIGINAMFVDDPFRDELLGQSSSGSFFLPSVNQSNIIIIR